MIIEPTPAQGIGLALKLLITSIALSYLYKSKTVETVLSISERSTSQVDKWLTTICIGVISVFTLYILVSISGVALNKDYDPNIMLEQYPEGSGYHTDGIVGFPKPSHYILENIVDEGTTIFSLTDSETEPSEAITIVSELNYELTQKEFEEYYEACKDKDFTYLSTTVVKDKGSTLEGKHYRFKSVYFEEYGTPYCLFITLTIEKGIQDLFEYVIR